MELTLSEEYWIRFWKLTVHEEYWIQFCVWLIIVICLYNYHCHFNVVLINMYDSRFLGQFFLIPNGINNSMNF